MIVNQEMFMSILGSLLCGVAQFWFANMPESQRPGFTLTRAAPPSRVPVASSTSSNPPEMCKEPLVCTDWTAGLGPRVYEYTCHRCFLTFSMSTQPSVRASGVGLSKRGRGFDESKLGHVISIALNNFVYSKYESFQIQNGLEAMPESSYSRIARNLVWPAIVNVAEELMAAARLECVQRAREGGFPIVFCCDGGWAHRGYHSKQACLPVKDFFSGKILFLFTAEHAREYERKGRKFQVAGSNPVSSKGAEAHMMNQLMELLANMADEPDLSDLLDLVYGFVIDSDSSASSTIRSFPHDSINCKYIFFDTGHGKKALQKAIAALVGQSEVFGKVARRVGLMYMGIVKKHTKLLYHAGFESLDEMRFQFSKAFVADVELIKRHYTTDDCDPQCPCLYIRSEAERVREAARRAAGPPAPSSASSSSSSSSSSSIPLDFDEDAGDDYDLGDEQDGADPDLAVDLTQDEANDAELVYRDRGDPGWKLAETKKWFFNKAAYDAKIASLDSSDPSQILKVSAAEKKAATVYEGICKILNDLIADAPRHAHPFNTCGVERFHGERTANCDKRLYYAATYRGRAHFTAAKSLVGWGVITLLYERLGITVTPALARRVDQLQHSRAAAYSRKKSELYSQQRSALQFKARADNKVRLDMSALKAFTYNVGAAKRLYTSDEIAAEVKIRETERARIQAMKQAELVAEWTSQPEGCCRWGWRCVCGYVVRGAHTPSATKTHELIKAHQQWLSGEGDGEDGDEQGDGGEEQEDGESKASLALEPVKKKSKTNAASVGACGCKGKCARKCPCKDAKARCTADCHPKAGKCERPPQDVS